MRRTHRPGPCSSANHTGDEIIGGCAVSGDGYQLGVAGNQVDCAATTENETYQDGESALHQATRYCSRT
jgi:hypothetical protein